jgi:hypothetical protein
MSARRERPRDVIAETALEPQPAVVLAPRPPDASREPAPSGPTARFQPVPSPATLAGERSARCVV